MINFALADRNAEARSRELAGRSARHKGVFTKTHLLDNLKSGKFLWNSQGCCNGRCHADMIYPVLKWCVSIVLYRIFIFSVGFCMLLVRLFRAIPEPQVVGRAPRFRLLRFLLL